MSKRSREDEVYQYIVEYTTKNLHAPSIREICQYTGIKSTSTVFSYLEKLKKRGLIDTGNNQSRCIVLVGYQLVKTDPVN